VHIVPDPPPQLQNSLPPMLAQDLTPAPELLFQDLRSSDSLSRSRVPGGATPMAVALRFVQPQWRNYIMYVDMESRAGNEDAKRYIAAWQALTPGERQRYYPEQLCQLACVQPYDLLSWVTRQAWIEGSSSAALCMSFMKDQVLEQTARFAMQSPENYKHTQMFLQASGLLPAANGGGRGGAGNGMTILNMPVASSGSVALAGSRSESSPVDASGLRSMDSEIVELSKIMQASDGDRIGAVRCAAEKLRDDDDEEEDDDEDDDSDD